MTTQTPADNRRTPEWKATFIDLSDALPFLSGYHTNKLADAIYNAVNRSLPEPQASKASEPYTPPPGTPDIRCAMCGSGMMTRLELGRLRKRVAELEAAIPSPASDRCTCDKFERGHDEHEPWCGGPAPSAPPPASEAEQPKCTHGQEDCEACHGEGSINCPHGCEPRRSAPTAPTPADAGSVSVPRDVAERWHTHGSYHSHNKADAEMVVAVGAALYAPSPSPSTTARAGFTYPDEAVDKALDAYWGGTATDMDINRAMVALRESRVTP